MSAIDPTVKGSKAEFKPERWLTPEGEANWTVYQHPFVSAPVCCATWLQAVVQCY